MKQEILVRSFSISLFIIYQTGSECRILLLKRRGSTQPGEWCQIAGGVEHGEKAWQTAIREAKEETGLTLSNLYSADYCERFYEADRDAITLVPVFISYVTNNYQITLNEEHSEYYWATLPEVFKMLPFPGQHMTLEFIHRFFVKCKPNEMLKMPL
ncbi:NUDIX hydrolase [Pectobacterium versatile]|uniref:NUDIX hydrolase n=1 Tax=Pectobacterium versatile TaxID=2488639 RepID=UPI001F21DCA7|nr:NUDIX domain-containing protein [Pectobacterium versatile]